MPLSFWFSSRYRNFGPSESACRHCAYPIPLSLTALKVIHERNVKRLGVLEHFHLPDRAWTLVAILAFFATSFPVLPHSCWCWMLRGSYGFLRWRCWRSRWRWAWRACRKTRDNEWYVVRRIAIDISAIVDEMWFLTTGPMVVISVIFA